MNASDTFTPGGAPAAAPSRARARKVLALVNVVSWGLFWIFGALALTAAPEASREILTAMGFAFIGLMSGTYCYLTLKREIG
ncbi:hypothetical protein [Pseudoruegeria sp. SHC-113]|uniref:hypothetical protein n=1 Tax=Pseudoruegeria sp. SHC-113 TaxID=2855439 RepID=UPI0021BB36A6|nr:hypothetical protein [Pseudoruegeria sp. SHC-113]MCT8162045.1 hypothetical protein [Pseudoruegeria sp. SHC-113]